MGGKKRASSAQQLQRKKFALLCHYKHLADKRNGSKISWTTYKNSAEYKTALHRIQSKNWLKSNEKA